MSITETISTPQDGNKESEKQEKRKKYLLQEGGLPNEVRENLEIYGSRILERLENESGGDVVQMEGMLTRQIDSLAQRVETEGKIERASLVDTMNLLKMYDLAFGESPDVCSTYIMREKLLQLSVLGNEPLSTSELFTRNIEFSFDGCVGQYGFPKEFFKPYQKMKLRENQSWVPERALFHKQAVLAQAEAVRGLSRCIVDAEIENKSPFADREVVQYALRGNTASGKSTLIRSNTILSSAIEKNKKGGNLSEWRNGVLNPDNFKAEILDFGVAEINTQQTHVESCAMNSMLEKQVESSLSDGSKVRLVHDKRLSAYNEIAALGRDAVVWDIAVPLKESLLGVLSRGRDTYEPRVIASAIAEGHEEIVNNRINVMIHAMEGKLSQYSLYAREGGDVKKIAELADGTMRIEDGALVDFLNALGVDIFDEVAMDRIISKNFNPDLLKMMRDFSGVNGMSGNDEILDEQTLDTVLSRYQPTRRKDPEAFLKSRIGMPIRSVVNDWQKRPISRAVRDIDKNIK